MDPYYHVWTFNLAVVHGAKKKKKKAVLYHCSFMPFIWYFDGVRSAVLYTIQIF